MKRYTLVLLMLYVALAFSQNMWDNALAIRQNGDLDWEQASVTTEENEIIHVWSEYNYGIRSILAMKHDNQGNPLWGQNPLVVADSDYTQVTAKVIRTNDDCFVVVWYEQSNQLSIRAQKLDASGNRLWSDSGILVSDDFNDNSGSSLVLYPNEIGGAIVSWRDSWYTLAQSLNSNGLLQWDEDGINLGSLSSYEQINSDGHGGLVIVDGQTESWNMSVRRVGASGEILWNESIELESSISDLRQLRIIYDNIDSYFLISAVVSDPINRIPVRKLSLTGELSSTVGYIPLTEDNPSLYCQHYITDTGGNLFVVNQPYYNGFPPDSSIIAYKLNSELNHVWDETGVLLGDWGDSQIMSRYITTSNSGDLLFLNTFGYADGPNINDANVFLYKVNADGTLQTQVGGLQLLQDEIICSSPYLSCEDDLFIVWSDISEGYRNLRQNIIDDDLQFVNPQQEEVVRRTLTGYTGYDFVSYLLPDSERSVIIWIDFTYPLDVKIKYQIIDSDASVEFAENGQDIADFTLDDNPEIEYSVTHFTSFQNDLGQICLAWYGNSGLCLRSRIIDSDGTLLGSENGEEISIPLEQISDIALSSYNNDFYLSFLSTNSSGSEKAIYGVKTNNGNEWTEPYLIDSQRGGSKTSFLLNRVINNFCIIQKNTQLYDIFKIADDGSVSEIFQDLTGYDYKFDCDAENNIFFIWNGGNILLAQGITADNDLYWDNPIQVNYPGEFAENGDIFNHEILVSEGINIFWNETLEFAEFDLRAQKLSYSGEKVWEEAGTLLSTEDLPLEILILTEIGQGHILTSWDKENSNDFLNPLNIINSYGEVVFNDNTNYISQSELKIYGMKTLNLPDNKLLFSWINYDGLYAQIFDYTTVDIDNYDTVLAKMKLMQNYPNPFNPETTISYSLPEAGDVKLDIYNIKGQKVRTLVNKHQDKGNHNIVWKGVDDKDKRVTSGIYLYRIESEKYSAIKKMILMK